MPSARLKNRGARHRTEAAALATDKLETRHLVCYKEVGCWLAPLVLLFMAGCAVGPNYKTPTAEVPAAFANGTQANFSSAEIAITWWRGFKDPRLDQLVDRALAGNHDLRIATANVHEARALRRQAQFDLLPAPQGTAGYTHSLYSQAFEPGVPRNLRNIQLYDAGFDATWELDFFGRVRRSVQANTAEWQAAEANRRDVMVTLISEVARNYFELLGAQGELDVARHNADNQRETLKITQAVLDGGRGTELDVARARAQLNNTLANIPPLEADIARAIHRLSVLVGQQPTALAAELQQPEPLPALPPLVFIGDPAMLLRRRSDVRAAERQLAAASARIGIATADLFPRVTFNGRLGLEASSFSGLTKGGSDTWSFGPSITWAALDYGHVRARMQAAGAQSDAQLARYEQTVLGALEETENSLVDFSREQTRREFLRESESASEIAATLARQRYENGATDFLTVLDAERVLYEAQDQLARSNTRAATALVAVYKSLGGGWEIELTEKPKS
ncbi:MAG: efflux transporter outer rane subunit [Pedosphaera sp.]|nr:efflux transporter outer rane subunit [Pedosphaera sp.]